MADSIVFIKQEWTKTAEFALAPALYDAAAFIKNEVETGVSELFFIPDYGWLVTRIEGSELVLVAAVGRAGYNVLDALERLARLNNMESIRMHSRRPGMERYLKRAGFLLDEKIFRKRLSERP